MGKLAVGMSYPLGSTAFRLNTAQYHTSTRPVPDRVQAALTRSDHRVYFVRRLGGSCKRPLLP